MRQHEREKWMELLVSEREAHRKERQELLNRIANPKQVNVDTPIEQEPREPERDPLAFIGTEVDDGVIEGEPVG